MAAGTKFQHGPYVELLKSTDVADSITSSELVKIHSRLKTMPACASSLLT